MLLYLLFSIAHADDWFCKSQSAAKQGPSTIIVCGTGSTRDAAMENALDQFKKLCQASSDCREFDYNVEPKRTECDHSECFQAIQFNILRTKRKEVFLDLHEIENQLRAKKLELQIQQDKLDKLMQLKTQSELSERNQARLEMLEKSLNQTKGEQLKLQDLSDPDANGYIYMHQLFKNSFQISTKYWRTSFFQNSELNSILDFRYEYRFNPQIGAGISYGFGTDLSSQQIRNSSDVSKTGPVNSTDHINGTTQIKDLVLSGTFYPRQALYVKVELGYAQATQKTYDVKYGPIGTVIQTQENTAYVSKTYAGASAGYDSRHFQKGIGFFGEAGFRESFSDGALNLVGNIGMNFGF